MYAFSLLGRLSVVQVTTSINQVLLKMLGVSDAGGLCKLVGCWRFTSWQHLRPYQGV